MWLSSSSERRLRSLGSRRDEAESRLPPAAGLPERLWSAVLGEGLGGRAPHSSAVSGLTAGRGSDRVTHTRAQQGAVTPCDCVMPPSCDVWDPSRGSA